MAQLLVQVVPVTALAAGASVTVPHSLESNGAAVAPTLIFPDRVTPIQVDTVTTTGVTFKNGGALTASANFRLERGWQPEVNASTVTPMYYAGGGSAASGRPVVQVAVLSAITAGISNGVAGPTALPPTYVVPANTYVAGSTASARIAGTFVVGGANTTCTITLRADAGTKFAEFATGPLAIGSYDFVADLAGIIETGAGKAHGSAQSSWGNPAVLNPTVLTGSNGTLNPAINNTLYAEVTFASGAGYAGTSLTLNSCTIDLVA
jgi:hypothetical protein